MILLRNFNRLFTIMRLPQFGNPMVGKLQELELPRNSILHYMPGAVTETGPAQTDPLLAKSEKQVIIRHHVEYSHEPLQGSPKRDNNTFNKEITLYHRVNRNVRLLREEKLIERDERTLFVENYAMLPSAYRYTTNQLSWYYELSNIYGTVIKTIADDLARYDRQNYLLLNVPDVIPAIAALTQYENKITAQSLKQFNTEALLRIADLWVWLGVNRDRSQLGKLPKEKLGKVNVVLVYQGKFVNINLGELDVWRKDEKTNPKGLVAAQQMQRRLYLTIVNLATKATEQTEVQVDDSPEHLQHHDEMEKELAIATTDMADVSTDVGGDDTAIIKEIEDFDKIELDVNQRFEIIKQESAVTEEPVDILRPLPLDAALMRYCDDVVANGSMSARDYNRIQQMSGKWKDIKVESGERLEDFIRIEPHMLVVEQKQLADAVTIIDKSTTVSTLPDLTRKYNRHLLQRDVASAAVSVQRGGFAVNGYEVERYVDAANCMEMHSLKVMTLNGKESTLRFTLPVIDDRGYWKANDITYTMRKQRIDVPIRKTAPDTVTITSFYGKNFIRRSDRSRDNWTKWLTDAIVAKGLDHEDLTVQNMHYANVMNPDIKLPRDYTAVSSRLAGFKLNNVTYNFDVKKIAEIFTEEEIGELAQQEMIPVAKQGQSLYAMDMFNTIFKQTGGNITPIGTLAELLGMDLFKAPKEYTELSMMGKALPIGLVFSYYLGLIPFLKSSGIKYELFDANERVKGEPNDLIFKFADAKLIIRPATYEHRLLINGLNRYSKLMVDYKLEDFNHKDVYLNLIQKDGLTVRYLRELDLMDNMFIDPITHRQLVKMKEPETFKGLLLRANELLTTDQHPDEIDADSMHYHGNQRIAGAVYTEMVRAIREYHAKPGSDKKLELHPNAVWQTIAQDGSVAPASDANPIQSIKENSVITYGGEGGRSRRSMVKSTRRFLKQDEGVLSGDVVDNGDVGMTAYLSANPQLEDVDGYLKKDREKTAASLFSSPMMLAPAALFDELKSFCY